MKFWDLNSNLSENRERSDQPRKHTSFGMMSVYSNQQMTLMVGACAATSAMFVLPDAAFLAFAALVLVVASICLVWQRYQSDVAATFRAAVEFSRSMVSAEEALTCCVCLEDLPSPDCEGEIRELDCGHCFHRCCVDSWLQRNPTCPLCKASAKPTVSSSHSPPRQWQDKLHRPRDPYRSTTPEQSARLKAVCLQMLQTPTSAPISTTRIRGWNRSFSCSNDFSCLSVMLVHTWNPGAHD